VLLHDDTLDRTTNCTGNVADWTLADLQSQCDASYKGKFGDKFADNHLRVPLFEDLLKAVSGTEVFIVMDLKAGLLFAQKVLPMLEQYSVKDHVIASCRTEEQMDDFMVTASVVPRQYLVTNYTAWDPNDDPQFYFPWTEKSIMGFSVKFQYIDAEFVKKTHARLMSVFSWVTDAPADVPDQITMGIDGIMTDNTLMYAFPLNAHSFLHDDP
jgi:glycerophosphoryl diester phosphodiesterase